MADDVKQLIQETAKATGEETRRHFDIVAEGLQSDIKGLGEQVSANTKKLEEHDKRFDQIDETLDTIKIDIEFIKNDLKQKVGRDEFVVLEQRVSRLEAKTGRQ